MNQKDNASSVRGANILDTISNMFERLDMQIPVSDPRFPVPDGPDSLYSNWNFNLETAEAYSKYVSENFPEYHMWGPPQSEPVPLPQVPAPAKQISVIKKPIIAKERSADNAIHHGIDGKPDTPASTCGTDGKPKLSVDSNPKSGRQQQKTKKMNAKKRHVSCESGKKGRTVVSYGSAIANRTGSASSTSSSYVNAIYGPTLGIPYTDTKVSNVRGKTIVPKN